MRGNYRVYDIEHHFSTQLMMEEFGKYMAAGGGYMADIMSSFSNASEQDNLMNEVEYDLGDLRLAALDKAGVDYAHVSLTTPGAEFFPVDISKKVAQDCNDRIGAGIKAHPDRIGGWMALSPEDPEWSVNEIARCVDMGLWGWSCLSNFNGKYLDDPKYWPILEKVESVGMPIYIHPTYPANIPSLTEFGYCIAGPSLGFTVDVLICVMRIICRGVLDKFPCLKIVLGHDGETLPFLMDRVDTAYRQKGGAPNPALNASYEHEPSYYIKNNFYCSTSGNFLHEALMLALREFTPDRVMVATDYPYEDFEGSVDLVEKNPMLLSGIKKAILADNAAALGLGPKK